MNIEQQNFESGRKYPEQSAPEKRGINVEKLAEGVENKIAEMEMSPEEKEKRRLGNDLKNKIAEGLKGKAGIAYAEALPEVFEKLTEGKKNEVMRYTINLLNEELMLSPLVKNEFNKANEIFDYMENSSKGVIQLVIEKAKRKILTPLEAAESPSKMDH